MIRGIDTQMMIQQTMNAAKVAGDRVADIESRKEFKAQLEQERIINEENSVVDLEKAEYRRIEREKDEQHEKDEFTDQEARMLWGRRKIHSDDEQQNEQQKKKQNEKQNDKERLFAGGVGFEIDIDV